MILAAELVARARPFLAGALLGSALVGCVAAPAFRVLSNSSEARTIVRSLTVAAKSSDLQSIVFIGRDGAASVSRIVRSIETGSTASTTLSTKSMAAVELPVNGVSNAVFVDDTALAGVAYKYKVISGAIVATPSKDSVAWKYEFVGDVSETFRITPLGPPLGKVILLGPGTSSADVASGSKVPVVGVRPEFTWTPLSAKEASMSHGLLLLVGREAPGTLLGMKPVYAAYLDEASHSSGAKYGTGTDMPAYSTTFDRYLAATDSLEMLAAKPSLALSAGPKTTEASLELARGRYAWTVISVHADAATRQSFAVGPLPPLGDPGRFLVFDVQ